MILQQHPHQQSAAYLKANKVLKYAEITFSYLSLCQAQREVMIFLFIVALIYVVWILTLLFLKPPNFPPGNYHHTNLKVKVLSKNSFLTKPQQFHEFFTQFF